MESSTIIAQDEKERVVGLMQKLRELREQKWSIMVQKSFNATIADLLDTVEHHPEWILEQKLLSMFLCLKVDLAGIEKLCGILCDKELETLLSPERMSLETLPIHEACWYSTADVVTFLAIKCPSSLRARCYSRPCGLPLDIVLRKMPMHTLKTLVTLNPSAVTLQHAIDKKYAWSLMSHIASLTPKCEPAVLKLGSYGLPNREVHFVVNGVLPKLSELYLDLSYFLDAPVDRLALFLAALRKNKSVAKFTVKLPKMLRPTTKTGILLLQSFRGMFEENTCIQNLCIYGLKSDLDQWFPALQQSLQKNICLRDLRFRDTSVDVQFKIFAPPPTDNQLEPPHFMTRLRSLDIHNVHNFNGTLNVFFQEILASCDCLQSLRFVAVTGYDAATFGRALANASVSFDRLIELISSVVSFRTFKTQGFTKREPTTFQFGFLRENPGLWCQPAKSTTMPRLESWTI